MTDPMATLQSIDSTLADIRLLLLIWFLADMVSKVLRFVLNSPKGK